MRKWQPDPNDAVAFAAFRWHVNKLENIAISKFVTRREAYEQILEILSKTAREMQNLNRLSGEMCRIDDDCGPG